MGISDILNLILSIVTISIAILALIQSNKQVKISNKQCLFKERVQGFMKFNDIVESYENERQLLSCANEEPYLLFVMLTKNSLLIEENFLKGNPLSKDEGDKFLNQISAQCFPF